MFFGHFVKKQRIDGQVSVYPLQIRVYSLYGSRRPVQPSCEAIRPFRAGDFALCGARERAARAAGAKREGHLRFPSLFELLPFPRRPRERALRPYFVSNSHKGTGIGSRFPRCRGVVTADCTGFA